MKKINIIICLIMTIIITACNNEDEDFSTHIDSSQNQNIVTFSLDTKDVSVLIFGKNTNDEFIYQKSINSGWSNGRVSTELVLGYYKFLFYRSAGKYTSVSPEPLTGSDFDNIKFIAQDETGKTGYVKQVDDILLPKSIDRAELVHHITDPTTVRDTLKRAVTQVNLNIKRGYKDGDTYKELPFSGNENVMKNIKEVTIDIAGVGRELNLRGTTGKANTLYTFEGENSIDNKGFATFKGPYVFPSSTTDPANITITVTPTDESIVSPPDPFVVKGPLEKNKSLDITLWLTSTYKIIEITVNTEFLPDPKDGDMGIWE